MEQQKESSAKIKLILQIQHNTISKRQETKAGREKETKKKKKQRQTVKTQTTKQKSMSVKLNKAEKIQVGNRIGGTGETCRRTNTEKG